MPQGKSKGKTPATHDLDDSWSDSDWSESNKKNTTQTGSQSRPHPPKVSVDKDSVSTLLDTFVKHGIAVKGEVSKDGSVSFVFRSAPGKLVPVAQDKPPLPAIKQPDTGVSVGFVEEPRKRHHHKSRHSRYDYGGGRRSSYHKGGFFSW